MTTLEETALSFARECLGWADARAVHPDANAQVTHFAVLSRAARPNTLFVATDPAEAEAAARQWCDGVGLIVTMSLEPGGPSATATVRVRGQEGAVAGVTAPHPSHALLGACVEARRRLAAESHLAP